MRRSKPMAAIAAALMLTASQAMAWEYEEFYDDMGRGPELHADVQSSNRDANLRIWSAAPKQEGMQLWIRDGLRIYAEKVGNDLYRTDINVRFDNGPIEKWEFYVMPSFGMNHGQIEALRSSEFVTRVRNATVVRIELTIYGYGSRIFTFFVRGLRLP